LFWKLSRRVWVVCWKKGNLTHVKSRMLAQEPQETRSSVDVWVCGCVVGKYMGGWGRVGGCVTVSSEGKKFHAATKGWQRKKEEKKETPSPNKNKINSIYKIVTGRWHRTKQAKRMLRS
jgi:hypothetical protein